jgi:hypothetical protein
MYFMLYGLFFDYNDSITLISMSLLYPYDNYLYMRSPFLLLKTFYNAWSQLVTICHELLNNLSFYLYTVCMTLVDAIYHYVALSKVRSPLVKISVARLSNVHQVRLC